jgi:hypothetical protein
VPQRKNTQHLFKIGVFSTKKWQKSPKTAIITLTPDFFSRVGLPSHFVRMALGRLRSDDLYSASRCYPNPEHRSTALAEQVLEGVGL